MIEVIKGAIVTPTGVLERGWIAIERGKIAAVGQEESPEGRLLFDAGNDFVFPGIVDGQTHAGSYAGLEGIRSTTRSAIAGGITTIVDMPYDNPRPLHTVSDFDAKAEAVEESAYCDVALYATIMPEQSVEDVLPLVAKGAVAFKVSLFESSPTRFPRIPANKLLELFEALAETDIPIGVHNEDQEVVLASIAKARKRGNVGIEGHASSRPLAAELAATAGFLELGAAAGAHAHIVHITATRGFRIVENYARDGFRTTGELCIHYLWFDPDLDGPTLGAKMKVNPPIRPGERDRLWADLLAGRVAFVSSDHSSWPLANKLTASIFDAGAGVTGLETLLPAFYTAAKRRNLDAAALTAAYLSERPSKFFGIWPQKGAIQVGADADLAILARDSKVWSAADAHDDLNWSPFDGCEFDGWVRRTYLRGNLVWDGQAIAAEAGVGTLVRRGTSCWFD